MSDINRTNNFIVEILGKVYLCNGACFVTYMYTSISLAKMKVWNVTCKQMMKTGRSFLCSNFWFRHSQFLFKCNSFFYGYSRRSWWNLTNFILKRWFHGDSLVLSSTDNSPEDLVAWSDSINATCYKNLCLVVMILQHHAVSLGTASII